MRFFIVVPVHNRLALTRLCLASLCLQTRKDLRVFLVDDGSTDGTSEAMWGKFSDLMDLEIIRGDGNLWWAGAIEKGVRAALQVADDDDYIVTLNNDLTVAPDFLSRAEEVLSTHPGAMVGGVSIDSQDGESISNTGWTMLCWPLAFTRRVWWPGRKQDLAAGPPVTDLDFLPGTATFTPVQVVRRYGTVNARLLPHYQADLEYSYRLKKHGVRVLLSRDLLVSHNMLATGVLSSVRTRPRLGEIAASFFSIRSANCFKYKFRFARSCCPAWALVPYMFSDTIKAMVRAFGAYFFGQRVEDLRARFN